METKFSLLKFYTVLAFSSSLKVSDFGTLVVFGKAQV
jgi:hypothetical protein